MRALRWASACAVALLALAAPVRQSSAADPVKLTITVPSVEVADAPYFIAAQKGYFAAEGLQVDFSFSGGGVATPALISGSVQGSASGSAALSAILRSADLRVVAVFGDSPAYMLWARNDIKTVQDLKGKSIGVATRGDTFELSTRIALQAAGFAPDGVAYTPLGFGNGIGAAFAGGGLPAVVLSSSQVQELQAQGFLKNAHKLLDYYGNVKMPWNLYALSEKFITTNPDVARRMMRAIVKGARYMRANKKETVVIVSKYQKDPLLSAIANDYDAFVPAFAPSLTVSNDVAAKDLLVRAQMIGMPADQIPPVEKAYDFTMVRSINAELDAAKWKPIP